MRSTYQPIYSPSRQAGSNNNITDQNGNSSQMNHFAKSPISKVSNLQYQHTMKNMQQFENGHKLSSSSHTHP